MKILAVDDSKTMISLISKSLIDMGYTDNLFCGSGDEALELLEEKSVDLILLDWHMPGLSGLDCLRIIKNSENTKEIPVIMLTVEEHPRSIEEALDSGAAAYLVKPINPEIFQNTLQQITGN